MDIFSNPMFSASNETEDSPLNEEKKKVSPRNSLLKETRTSISSMMLKFKAKASAKKKDKSEVSQANKEKDQGSLEPLSEENQGQPIIQEEFLGNDGKNISIIESESGEINKLKYEASLLSFTNKELTQKLEDHEKETVSLKELLKISEAQVTEKQQQILELNEKFAGITEDLQRLQEDNSRLLQQEQKFSAEIDEKTQEIEDFRRVLKEKDRGLADFEVKIKGLQQKFDNDKEKLESFYEEQIQGLKLKITSLEAGFKGSQEKEKILSELQASLEQEKVHYEENTKLWEEDLRLRDQKIQELQSHLTQKESFLQQLQEGLKQSSQDQINLPDYSKELEALTQKYEQQLSEAKETLLQENRELLDTLEQKTEEFTKKEQALLSEKKTLESLISEKDKELFLEKEALCEEKLKLSNERLDLEQKIRVLTHEIEESKSRFNSLSTEFDSIQQSVNELEGQKLLWFEEKASLEARLLEEKAKEITLVSEDLESRSQTLTAKLEEAEIETLVFKEKAAGLEAQIISLKSQLDSKNKENESLVREILEAKQSFGKEKAKLLEEKKHVEANVKKFEGSMQEKETMIQELMGSLIEKESYIRNSVIEKDSELTKLRETYEQEIGFYKKNEQEKNQIYDNLMNKLLQGEKLLQSKQSTLAYFQENYQKVLKEKESLDSQYKEKSHALVQMTQSLESSQQTLATLEKRLKELSSQLDTLTKDLEIRKQEKTEAISQITETFELKLKAEKSALDSKLREKDLETLQLKQELNKQRLQNEDKAAEFQTKSLKLEQEYQTKLLELSKSSETSQKEALKKLEGLLDSRAKELMIKDKRNLELEDSIRTKDKELKEILNTNKELQEKIALFLQEKEALLKETAGFREQRLRGFEARVQEMQLRFNNELETLSLQKIRLREDYEVKLDNKSKELNEIKTIRKGLEEKVLILTKEKEILTKENTLIKEKQGKAGLNIMNLINNNEDSANTPGGGNWLTNATKQLKVENRLLQEEKKRIIEDYEAQLKAKNEEIETLKATLQQYTASLSEESNKNMQASSETHVKSLRKKALFKENEVYNDVSMLKEKVTSLLMRYQSLLEALKDKNSVDFNLKKYLSEPVNEILNNFCVLMRTYYETEGFSSKRLPSLQKCQHLSQCYFESGGNLEKELNESLHNCLDFIAEFYNFVDHESFFIRNSRKRSNLLLISRRPSAKVAPEGLPEGINIIVNREEVASSNENNNNLNNSALSIRVFKTLERVNGHLQHVKQPKIKEKVLILCIIVKSFLNNEGESMSLEAVVQEIQTLKQELHGNQWFLVALLDRVARLLRVLYNKEEGFGDSGENTLESVDSEGEEL